MPDQSILSNLIRSITQFSEFTSRLGRQLSVWVFVSIVLVETIILIPSYLNLEQDLLERIDDKGRTITEYAMGHHGEKIPPSDLAVIAGSLLEHDLFLGISI